MNKLIHEYQQSRCNELATKLIIQYQPIVNIAARKMSRNKPDLYEELFQVGQISLLRLFDLFDYKMGIPFEAYAMKSIIGHLKNHLRDKSWFVKVPRKIKEKSLQIQNAVDELNVKLERSPRLEEIAHYLELTVEETIEIMAGSSSYNYISLDAPLSTDEDSSTIGDLLSSQIDDFYEFEMRTDIAEVMVQLEKDEQVIIYLIFNEGKSQRQIAVQLGITQMSVSRIQKRALIKLRALLVDETFSTFTN